MLSYFISPQIHILRVMSLLPVALALFWHWSMLSSSYIHLPDHLVCNLRIIASIHWCITYLQYGSGPVPISLLLCSFIDGLRKFLPRSIRYLMDMLWVRWWWGGEGKWRTPTVQLDFVPESHIARHRFSFLMRLSISGASALAAWNYPLLNCRGERILHSSAVCWKNWERHP